MIRRKARDRKHLEVYRADDGWRWRAVAGNHRIVDQGEAHPRKWNAKRAARAAHPGWRIEVLR